ncbi:MAG: TolC family protein [Pseudomonadota bacterium]
MSRSKALMLAVTLAGTTLSAWAQTSELDDVIITNPRWLEADTLSDAAEFDLDQARALRLPNFRIEGNQSVLDDTITTDRNGTFDIRRDPRSAALVLEVPLYTSGVLSGRIATATAGLSARQAAMDAIRQDILFDYIRATSNVVQARRSLSVRIATERVLLKRLAEARARLASGLATETELSLARERVEGARAESVRAQGLVRSSEAVYWEIADKPPAAALSLPRISQFGALPSSLPEAIDTALRNNPDLRISSAQIARADGLIRTARGQRGPQVSLRGQAAYADEELFGTTVGQVERVGAFVDARWTVFDFGALKARENAERSRKQALTHNQDALRRRIRREVVERWNERESAIQQVVRREAQLAAAELSLEGLSLEASAGRRLRVDVLDAERDVSDTRVALSQARANILVAEAGLLALLGRLSEVPSNGTGSSVTGKALESIAITDNLDQ